MSDSNVHPLTAVLLSDYYSILQPSLSSVEESVAFLVHCVFVSEGLYPIDENGLQLEWFQLPGNWNAAGGVAFSFTYAYVGTAGASGGDAKSDLIPPASRFVLKCVPIAGSLIASAKLAGDTASDGAYKCTLAISDYVTAPLSSGEQIAAFGAGAGLPQLIACVSSGLTAPLFARAETRIERTIQSELLLSVIRRVNNNSNTASAPIASASASSSSSAAAAVATADSKSSHPLAAPITAHEALIVALHSILIMDGYRPIAIGSITIPHPHAIASASASASAAAAASSASPIAPADKKQKLESTATATATATATGTATAIASAIELPAGWNSGGNTSNGVCYAFTYQYWHSGEAQTILFRFVPLSSSLLVNAKWSKSGAAVAGAKVPFGREHLILRMELPVALYVNSEVGGFAVDGCYRRVERLMSSFRNTISKRVIAPFYYSVATARATAAATSAAPSTAIAVPPPNRSRRRRPLVLICELPNELLLRVLLHGSSRELIALSRTSVMLHRASSTPLLWKLRCFHEFGVDIATLNGVSNHKNWFMSECYARSQARANAKLRADERRALAEHALQQLNALVRPPRFALPPAQPNWFNPLALQPRRLPIHPRIDGSGDGDDDGSDFYDSSDAATALAWYNL